MNIFATSPSAIASALWLDDKRANQMIRESCQLLSTTINLIENKENPKLYANFTPNHPCRLWVGSNRNRFAWLAKHCETLLDRAKPETHERAREVLQESRDWWGQNKWKLPNEALDPFQNSAGNEEKEVSFKSMKDVHLAYRLYLNARWKTDHRQPTWNTGKKPVWCEI